MDPLHRTLEIYHLQDAHYLLLATHADVAAIRAEPFTALELDAGRWWFEGGEPA